MTEDQLELLLKARQLNAVTIEQATEQITRAEQFLETAETLIGTLPPIA